jgi:hypothetical protein
MSDFTVTISEGGGGCGCLGTIAIIMFVVFGVSILSDSKNSPDPIVIDSNNTITKSVGNWDVGVSNAPNGLEFDNAFIIQCRENANSNQLVQDYLGVWTFNVNSREKWVNHADAVIVVHPYDSDTESYEADSQYASNAIGWSMPSSVLAPASNDTSVTGFTLVFQNVDWSDSRRQISDYSYSFKLIDYNTYGDGLYPRHQMSFRVTNNDSTLTMEKVYFFGIVENYLGEAVDILKSERYEEIDSGMSSVISMQSVSDNGRCVGSTYQRNYTLHFWMEFETLYGEPLTDYNTIVLSE